MIAAKTQNVKALSFVEIKIVQTALQYTAVLKHAAVTQTVSIKNATLMKINVAWIPTAQVGHSAVKGHHAVMVKETVILTQNARGLLFVVVTIV